MGKLKTRPKSYYGDGKGLYSYRESDVKFFENKKFLGREDSIEQAINLQLARARKKKK